MAIGNLENLMEAEVIKTIREIIESGEVFEEGELCSCHDCLVDIAAIALNMLPPHYVADKYYKFPDPPTKEKKRREQVQTAVRFAIKKVIKRPHHDK